MRLRKPLAHGLLMHTERYQVILAKMAIPTGLMEAVVEEEWSR
jgi:hypothetical protein